jgi:hypothetical protein
VPEAETERRNKIERVKNRADKLVRRFFGPSPGRESDEAKARAAVPWAAAAPCCPLCTAALPTGLGGALKFIGAVVNDAPVRANCWMCGAGVCDREHCSEMLVLQEVATFLGLSLPPGAAGAGEVAIRGCRTCKDIVQDASGRSKAGAGHAAAGRSALVLAYGQLRGQQAAADRLMPDLSDAVGRARESVAAGGGRGRAAEAKLLPKELTDCFARVTALAARIEALPECASGLHRQIAAHIKRAVAEWVQPRSFTLQSLSLEAR